MNSFFEFRSNEYIINFQVLSIDVRRTVNYGIETIIYIFAHPPTHPFCIKKIEEHLDHLIRYKKHDSGSIQAIPTQEMMYCSLLISCTAPTE